MRQWCEREEDLFICRAANESQGLTTMTTIEKVVISMSGTVLLYFMHRYSRESSLVLIKKCVLGPVVTTPNNNNIS